ncbi:hypothetical protein DSL72_004353 [Monilinia vaccinii-corymbosi]|uniref:Uncharacterized protein n=1 Tax=Monilinia vaccinii-corymbosi TaxID=61207 RepID=A0A8A3NVU8_9HELO|nr:hypothetical protein DSL72_004353 [Monilinia vaccinii-corymbosi]
MDDSKREKKKFNAAKNSPFIKSSKANSFHAIRSTTNGDQKPARLITIQSTFPRNDTGKENICSMTACETTIFEKLPLIRSLFELNRKGTFKNHKNQFLHDPEYVHAETSAMQTAPGKILYVRDLVESKFTQFRDGYDRISKWNLKTLWTLTDCLVRFLDGQVLHADSRIGRSEKFWQRELEGVEVLAVYFGNMEFKGNAVRTALVSYMRQVPAAVPGPFAGMRRMGNETTTKLQLPEMRKAKKPCIIDLMSEDDIRAPRKSKSSTRTQKLKKKPRSAPQGVKKKTQSTPALEVLPSIPQDAYIQLNASYPGFLRVNIDTALKGSRLIGGLLKDLHSETFAAASGGELSRFVGADRDGKPTLLWDEVLMYLRKPGNAAEAMLSWGEDDRWAPLVMFVERCQVHRALWQDWDEGDLELARCFDSFVKARVCASEVQHL